MKNLVILFFAIILNTLKVAAQTHTTPSNSASDSLKKTIPEMRRVNHGLSAQPNISGSEIPNNQINKSVEHMAPDTTKRPNKSRPQAQKQ